jgi:hypothetical protein
MPPVPEGLTAALSDRYRLERELGAGGMATVYLAEDLKHSRQVAIKVLRPDLAQAIGPERFLREVGIAARLSHPHIVGLIDSGEAAGFLYYVMPYVEGISLRQKLQRVGELPIPEAVRILRDIADALAYAHRQGVVHRDIKPENVMLVERHALVMDFGVAKALAEGKEEGSSSLTSAGVALGTPAYMAPEQAAGETHVDHRADLYAWGVVAYELLAGQPPFVRSTPQNTLAAQVTATPEPVTHHRATVPGALAHLVMQCLEKKPADRPQTAEEVLRQLDQVLTPSGGMTPTDTRPYQTAASRRARRRTLLTGAAMVVGLAVLGGLSWRWWQGRGVSIVADRVVFAPFRNETGKADLGDLGWRLAEAASGVVTREGITDPVPAEMVRERLGTDAARTTGALRRLAHQTGAGLVVAGNYRTRGDSLEVRAEVYRMPAGTKLYDLPVVGAAADPTLPQRLAESVALAVLLTRDWGDAHRWGQDFRMPASLAAYRAWEAGEDAGTLARAVALDPAWPRGRLEWIGFLPDSLKDSLLRQVRDSATHFLAGDRDLLEAAQARLAGDRERAYQAWRRRYLRDPVEFRAQFQEAAYVTNRWREAVEAGPGQPSWWERRMGIRSATTGLLFYLYSFHALGWHDSLLARAGELRNGDEFHPDVLSFAITAEIMTHAALGNMAVVDSLLREAAGMTLAGNTTSRDQVACFELRAHGQVEAARRVCNSWADQVLAGTWRDFGAKWWVMHHLPWLGRHEEARALEQELLLKVPGHALQGLIAVRAGDRAKAYAMVDSLRARPVPLNPESGPGEDALRILCALGDTARAIAQFQEVRRTGDTMVFMHFMWHRDPGYELIRDHPAFQAALRPRE